MSEENVESVRAGYIALARGDMKTVLDLIDENIVIEGHVAPDVGPAQGRNGLLANLANVREAFDELHYEPLEMIALEERVLVHICVSAKGREGIEVQHEFGQVWTFRDGKAVRLQTYPDWEQALEAAGVKE